MGVQGARRPAIRARMRQITTPPTMLPRSTPSAMRANRRRLAIVISNISGGIVTVAADGAARSEPRAGGSLAGNDSRLA